ncbi:MAG: D-alanyl-D-alanine carboxypeptidase/D-alanyl-D-alanine-endopeptidase, partial [Candidatus Edwardsbacteria bacterium]|nr:D-alanyl-D-alanine carboxypeptidase/D-alanyl-D-alanine-endopeptidase [Candidatus Edwardsbacteria bacterium]
PAADEYVRHKVFFSFCMTKLLRNKKFTVLTIAAIAGALLLEPVQAAVTKAAPKSAVKAKSSSRKKARTVFYLPKPTGDLQQDLDQLFSKKLGRIGVWGIAVMDLTNDSIVYQYHSDDKFIPASNTKLFTTAAALEKLGPEYTYRTEVYACGPVDSQGVLHGDLLIKGSGDPTIGDVQTLMEWADSIRAMGIASVGGDVIGDEGNFVPEKLVSMVPRASNRLVKPKKRLAWQLSGLSFRDNMVLVTVSGTELGKPLRVTTDPPMIVKVNNKSKTLKGGYYTATRTIKRRNGTVATKNVRVYRGGTPSVTFDGEVLKVTGTIGLGGSRRVIFMAKEPESHFARIFAAVLRMKEIQVGGEPASMRDKTAVSDRAAALLYAHHSKPLAEIIKVINKSSHNLYAETLVKTLGTETGGEGSVEQGAAASRSIAEEMGLGELDLADGCGLSRQNEVTPLQVVNLLKFMYEQPYWEIFYNSLAVGGIDGTLGGRFSNPALSGRICAKTGSIGGVSALSGYLTAKNGKMFAFSILVNNISRAKLARRIEDYICRILVEYLS